MYKVLVTRKISDKAIGLLKERFEVVVFDQDRAMTSKELLQEARDCDAVLTQLSDKINASFLEACPKVKVIANYAVGYDNFDVEYAKGKGIVLTNTPDVLSETTAELAIALLFATTRRIGEAERYLRGGHWHQFSPELLLGQDVNRKTIGVLGAGRIGRAFVKKLSGFEPRWIYHNRHRDELFEKKYGVEWVDFESLIENSDILSIHVPLTEATRHMIGKTEFKKMKKNAIIINTARGAVIDEEALANAIERGLIWGAGLDVFEDEPQVHPKLIASERVVLTPHIGSASQETREKMAVLAAENIIEVLNDRRPLTPVY